ncbi:hypothetical protein [Nocardioides donggukensis]|uniref:Uncharacterized protein n=1 Tax=Nocardioides donggukensis TaxID=2774019 RepID=A0A927K8F1_9ACTN|nr:hypothetical protein [Nocardioides donggukensis]MBD8869681.1 hypothetical protein [Nocardioides donggukensis]
MTHPAGAAARLLQLLRDPVVGVGLGMVGLHTVFRAWALYPSWFYADDYRLLYEARGELSAEYLLRPFDSQFMPVGRLLAWAVQHSGTLNWPLAASLTLGIGAAAAVACLWALVTMFGPRWGILAPLALYLTTAVVTPAGMWWAASLNQVPHQLVIFLSIGCWVRYLRGPRHLWLGLTLLVLLVGLLSYVKTVFLFPVLAYLLLAFFASGGARRRVLWSVRRYWPAAASAATLALVFTVYYASHVPSLVTGDGDGDPSGLAGTLIGTSLVPGMVGGPWTWWNYNPPVPVAQPPEVAAHLAWVAVAFVIAYLYLTRRRTGRVWALLAGYTVSAYLVLATTRGSLVGALAGLEYRYLTDVGALFPLCLGLASMRLLGAVESTVPREEPMLTVAVPSIASATAVALVGGLGVFSSVRYVHVWHSDNPGETYVKNAREGLRGSPATVVDVQVPDTVIPANAYPANLTSILLPVVSGNAEFDRATPELVVLDDAGNPRRATFGDAIRTGPGPREGCGWKVTSRRPATIPLGSRTYDWGWWVRIGYLSSDASPVVVRAGDDSVTTVVEPGLNSLYVQLTGAFDTVEIDGLADGTQVCVDVVEVGNPEPGGEL